jgi:NADPH-dependent glutamate synthase beta subunit-like oxidoreductase
MGPVMKVPKLVFPRSFGTTRGNKTGSWRYLRPLYDEKTSPCSAACPAGEDIASIALLATQGLFKEAWEKILWENPFPSICGRVCFHPCESGCNRREFDSPVAIRTLERFLADTASRLGVKPSLERGSPRKERVAIIGAGPAGLAAAWFLTFLGYRCHLFEATAAAGGILRWGIPAYRLPPAVLAQEIRRVEEAGAVIKTAAWVDETTLAGLKRDYQALFVACGHGRPLKMEVAGGNGAGIGDGWEFLRRLRAGERPPCEGQTAVIGGGNTAVDVARSVVRLGGQALILYRRRREDMPAFEAEVLMALEEGVSLRELVWPRKIEARGGKLLLALERMMPAGQKDGRGQIKPTGEFEQIEVARVLTAIGAGAAASWQEPESTAAGLRLSHTQLTWQGRKGVMVYGGDLTNTTKTVAQAIASGKQAALALDIFFRQGREAIVPQLQTCQVGDSSFLSLETYLGGERRQRNSQVVLYENINHDHFQFRPRLIQPRLLKEERIRSFAEIELKVSAQIAMKEAERCFNCGLCNQCDNCYIYCPDASVLRHAEGEPRRVDYDYCKGCGLCVVECPRYAMSLVKEVP